MKIGTCDCCEAKDVELVRSEMAGLETWSCWEECQQTPTRGAEAGELARRIDEKFGPTNDAYWTRKP